MTMLEILARFEAVKQSGPQRWQARCRAHEDHDPSLTITETTNKALLHCHAGCTQEAAVTAAGLTMTDLFFDAPTSKRTPRLVVGPRPGLTLEAFARAKGFTVPFLEAHGVTQNGTGLDIAYRLRDGALAPRQRARTALVAKDGSYWTGPKGAPLVPYGLEDLDAAHDQGELWVCEGETDRLTACWHGLPCLGLPGASMAKLLTAEHLAGIERLFIMQEPGESGTAFVRGVAARLAELLWTGEARVVRLPVKDLNELHLTFGEAFAMELAKARAASALLPAAPAPEAEPGPKVLIGGAISTAVVTEPRWLVEGLFSEPDQHLIVGSAGGGKTWLLTDLALAVSAPTIATYLGQPVRRHGRVCLESWEQGQTEDLRRLHKLAHGHGLPIASAFDALILLSETPGTLSEESYFTRRLRELIEWGVILYAVDSLSEAAGIELNDNTAYTDFRRARIRPFLDAGISVILTHLTGHAKPGVGRTRESVVRNATQIRALSSNIVEARQLGETTFKLLHNKHRNSTGLALGTLELAGTMADPFVTLRLTAEAAAVPPATKEALARRLLLALGAQHSDTWLTRKAIDVALNDPDAPKRIDPKERVSKRAWEPALDALVTEGCFETGKLSRADAWRLKNAETALEPDLDADEDEE